MCNKCLSCVIFVCLCVFYATCYNVDTVNFVEHRGESDSMFGFTVAVHKEQGRSWVLVGAPEGQAQGQPTVRKGGAVYRCETERDNACSEIPFDRNGANVDEQGNEIDMKSFQWFGATLNSAGEDGPIVACAPRYVSYSKQRNRRDPVGTCYVARENFGSYSEYSPCRTARWGYHRQGSCQAGLGAAISKDGRRLFVGAPGSWYWQGQTYSIDANARFPFTPGLFGDKPYGAGQVIQQSLETRPAVISTSEGPPWDDDSYMGYSVTVGYFTGDKHQGVAVGMPRGASLFGKVLLFSWNLTNHQNITGKQLGAYFGYSLATTDVDGDGLDDLLIGAPLHTQPNSEGKYEVGRVYVLFQGGSRQGRFHRVESIDGVNSKSRFGLSLASVGDINLDGYGDFAVGAPYDGPRENGAVYIYHGSKSGIREKYSQVIYAEEVAKFLGKQLTTFGFSVSGGMDLDGNDYPDMVVGAYLSNTAFFFRSRPVVAIEASTRFLGQSKEVFLEDRNCTHRGQSVYCTNVEFCVKYSGRGIPDTLNLNVHYILDAKKPKNKRMFFLTDQTSSNETMTLVKGGRVECARKYVYINSEIRDKLTPLEVEVRYFLDDGTEAFQAYNFRRDPRSVLRPVLDQNVPTFVKDSISIHKNCGSDNVCIPDLELNVTSNVDRYLLDSNNPLILNVMILNKGEDAFESTFDIKNPPAIDFIKITEEQTEVRISCSQTPNHTIHCEIGNPLPGQKIASFKIHLQPHNVEGMSPSYEFDMWVNSTNPEIEETVENNRRRLSIGIWIDSKLELRGSSIPPEIHYNDSLYKKEEIRWDRQIGPQVTHVYSIVNQGPAAIQEAEVFFIWPYALFSGEDLLYLLLQPNSSGDVNVVCDSAPANYKEYLIDYRALKADANRDKFTSNVAYSGREGVIIEEGAGISGTVAKDYKATSKTDEKIDSTGDSSSVFQQRHEISQGGGTGGKKVSVTSTGSRTITDHTSSGEGGRYNQGGGYNRGGGYNQGGGYYQGGSYEQNSSGSREYGARQGGGRTETIYYGSGSSNRVGSAEASSGGSRTTHTSSNQGGATSGGRTETLYYGSDGSNRVGSAEASSGGSRTTSHTSSSSGSVPSTVSRTDTVYYNTGGSRTGSSTSSPGIDLTVSGHHTVDTNGDVTVEDRSYGSRVHTQNTSRHFTWNGQSGEAADEYPRTGGNYAGYDQRGGSTASRGQEGGYRQSTGQSTYQHSAEAGRAQGAGRTESTYQTEDGGYGDYDYRQDSHRSQSGSQSNRNRSYGRYDNTNAQGNIDQYGIGGAALGQGFRTNTLDLGTLGNVNINEGVSDTYGTTSHVVPNGIYDSDESRTRGQSGGHSRTYSSGGGGGGSYSTSYESRHWSGSGPHYGEAVGRDNVATDKPDPNARFVGRKKRQAGYESDLTVENIKQCKAGLCRSIRCTLGPMRKGDEAVVELKFRVAIQTLKNISTSQSIDLSSMMLARINKLKYIGTPKTRPLESLEIGTTVVAPKPDIKPDVVPLWVVVLSAVAGTLILLLLIFLLYKCGFFKRNRHSDAPERQPLNRNGYHHGDEAL